MRRAMKHDRLRRILAAAACLLLAGCRQPAAQPAESQAAPVTLRLLLRGSATGLDRALETLYAQMDAQHNWRLDITLVDSKDYARQLEGSLNAHEDYDLVFDAQWLSLVGQAERGSYRNLKSYFSNPDYPGLQAAFPEEYLDANRINGELYAIPFTNTYYDVTGIYYRKDLLAELDLGFTEITTREQMEAYWQAVQAQGRLKPLTLGSRGFYQINLPEISLRQQGFYTVTGWSFWDYPHYAILSQDGGTVLDVVFPGDDAARFALAPEPYNDANLLDEYLLQNAAYAAYLDPNDLLRPDGKQDFLNGLSASCEGTLGSGGTPQLQQQLEKAAPGAEVGFWAYDTAFDADSRANGAIPVDYSAWNYLCIPAYSSDPDEAMAFLDWLYSDWSRLDLFNYGVEGVDWIAVGQEEYRLLESQGGAAFSFPAYELAWNPLHHRLDATLSTAERELMEYAYDTGSYTASPLAGFHLRTSAISIELARLNALYAEYYTGFCHGTYGEDTAARIAELHARSEQIGLETVRAEVIRQLQEFLDARAG